MNGNDYIRLYKEKLDALTERHFITPTESAEHKARADYLKYHPYAINTNNTNYASIYGIFESNGEQIGTYILTLAGVNAGKTEIDVWKAGYNKRDIKYIFNHNRIY